jgi:hypothetical protein
MLGEPCGNDKASNKPPGSPSAWSLLNLRACGLSWRDYRSPPNIKIQRTGRKAHCKCMVILPAADLERSVDPRYSIDPNEVVCA